MKLKVWLSFLLVTVLGTLVTGCGLDVEPGFVSVELREVAVEPVGDKFTVTVTGEDGNVIETSRLSEGSLLTLGSVPFGSVKVDVETVCIVESQLSAERPNMEIVVDGANCELTE